MTVAIRWAAWALMLGAALGGSRLAAQDPGDELPRYHEYERQIGRLIHAEATAKSPAERAQAIHDMAALFTQLRRDPRLDASDVLRGYRTRLWGRLMFIKKDLEREISRRERNAKRVTEPLEDDVALDFTARNIAASLDLVAHSLGGPAKLLSQGQFVSAPVGEGAPGGGTWDYGRDLVRLIQRTVYPDFWDVHGGPGTIVYYAPLRCLVVRATGGVHSTVGGFIGGLRK